MKKRIFSLLCVLAVVLVFAMTAQTAQAQDEINGLTYNTEGDYYEIGSAAALTAFANYSNESDTNARTFKMTADIDLSEVNWTPIGKLSMPFAGTFCGNGYKITGLHINTDQDNAGLFGVVDGATIDGVVVENASVTAASNCGILVGYVKDKSTFYRCKAAGSVSGSQNVGGFAGAIAIADNSIVIRECFAIGDATGSNTYYTQVGGFVGTIAGIATISDCYSLVTAKGAQCVGGFVGYMSSGSPDIMRCYSAGVVDCSGAYAGAFVGYPKMAKPMTARPCAMA